MHPSFLFLRPNGGEATAIDTGEWLLPAGSKESRWIRKTGAVLSVVVGSAGVEGVADGELRGGGGLGSKVLLWLWGFPIKIE